MLKSPGSLVTLAKNVCLSAIQNCPRIVELRSSDSFGWHSDGHFCQSLEKPGDFIPEPKKILN